MRILLLTCNPWLVVNPTVAIPEEGVYVRVEISRTLPVGIYPAFVVTVTPKPVVENWEIDSEDTTLISFVFPVAIPEIL